MAERLHHELREKGVRVFLNCRVVRITSAEGNRPAQVVLDNTGPFNADLVVAAVGIRPRIELAEKAGLKLGSVGVDVNATMQTSDPDLYAIGDVIQFQNIVSSQPMHLALAGPANRQGRLVADHICGRKVHFRGYVGTAVCKVFDLTVALVGFSMTSLKRMGRGEGARYVTVHTPGHASYYPGAEA